MKNTLILLTHQSATQTGEQPDQLTSSLLTAYPEDQFLILDPGIVRTAASSTENQDHVRPSCNLRNKKKKTTKKLSPSHDRTIHEVLSPLGN